MKSIIIWESTLPSNVLENSLQLGVINPKTLNDFDLLAGNNNGLSLCCHAYGKLGVKLKCDSSP